LKKDNGLGLTLGPILVMKKSLIRIRVDPWSNPCYEKKSLIMLPKDK